MTNTQPPHSYLLQLPPAFHTAGSPAIVKLRMLEGEADCYGMLAVGYADKEDTYEHALQFEFIHGSAACINLQPYIRSLFRGNDQAVYYSIYRLFTSGKVHKLGGRVAIRTAKNEIKNGNLYSLISRCLSDLIQPVEVYESYPCCLSVLSDGSTKHKGLPLAKGIHNIAVECRSLPDSYTCNPTEYACSKSYYTDTYTCQPKEYACTKEQYTDSYTCNPTEYACSKSYYTDTYTCQPKEYACTKEQYTDTYTCNPAQYACEKNFYTDIYNCQPKEYTCTKEQYTDTYTCEPAEYVCSKIKPT